MVARVGDKVIKPETRDEPHIGSQIRDDEKPATELTGYVRGGTTNPQKGSSGDIERLGPDGKKLSKAKADDTKGGA